MIKINFARLVLKNQPTRPAQQIQLRQSNQSGQIGIIIILIMIVLLTIGLSLATQSTKEIFLSNQEDESARVFNAAEAGVQQALTTDLTNGQSPPGGSISVPGLAGVSYIANYSISALRSLETRVPEGATATVRLTDKPGVAPSVDSLKIDWGKEADCSQNPATLIAAVFSYDNSTLPKSTVRYYSLPPCVKSDGMPQSLAVTTLPASNVYHWEATVPILHTGSKTDVLVRIKPYYNDTSVQIVGTGPPRATLPVQSYIVDSSATNPQSAQVEGRAVEVNRTLPAAPSVMDYVVFSGANLAQ